MEILEYEQNFICLKCFPLSHFLHDAIEVADKHLDAEFHKFVAALMQIVQIWVNCGKTDSQREIS